MLVPSQCKLSRRQWFSKRRVSPAVTTLGWKTWNALPPQCLCKSFPDKRSMQIWLLFLYLETNPISRPQIQTEIQKTSLKRKIFFKMDHLVHSSCAFLGDLKLELWVGSLRKMLWGTRGGETGQPDIPTQTLHRVTKRWRCIDDKFSLLALLNCWCSGVILGH